jgi:hypothetical protein
MLKAKKKQSKISLFPTDQQINSLRKKLPVFKAHDLRSLISESGASSKVDLDTALISVFRKRNEIQMNDLLQRLGVDTSQPDAWLKGFFHLATIHHGVGHIAWYPPRGNRNSATWTPTHDAALLSEVIILRQKGFSERRAIKKLAADPKKRGQFPYRKQGYRFSIAEEPRKREAALWSRLQKLKAAARGTSIVDLMVGTSPEGLSSIEHKLFDLDLLNSLPKELVEIEGCPKKARS